MAHRTLLERQPVSVCHTAVRLSAQRRNSLWSSATSMWSGLDRRNTMLFMSDAMAVSIRWTGLGTGLWDWTHRKLRSSFLKARKQEIAERHYIATTVDNSLPNTRGVPTQLSPCRQPAVVLPCKTSSTVRFGANSSMI